MKRKYWIILITLIFIGGFVLFYKWKQKDFLGLSEPKIETIESITAYAKEHNLKGELFFASDSLSQIALDKYFNYGLIFVINSDSLLLNCNQESLGGECYQDIQDQLCKGFPITARKFKDVINGKMIIDSLFANSQTLQPKTDWKNYKYTIIYSWVKYSKACIEESTLRFIKCVENNPEVRLISVNTDRIEQ